MVLHWINVGETDTTLVLSIKAWFQPSVHICSQNDRFPMLIHEVPLPDVMISV